MQNIFCSSLKLINKERLELRKCLRCDGIFTVMLIVQSRGDSDEPNAHD